MFCKIILYFNKNDTLLRVPKNWLHLIHSAVAINFLLPGDIKLFHNLLHLGVNRISDKVNYPVAKVWRKDVKSIVKKCEQCQSVGPLPIWRRISRLKIVGISLQSRLLAYRLKKYSVKENFLYDRYYLITSGHSAPDTGMGFAPNGDILKYQWYWNCSFQEQGKCLNVSGKIYLWKFP